MKTLLIALTAALLLAGAAAPVASAHSHDPSHCFDEPLPVAPFAQCLVPECRDYPEEGYIVCEWN